MTAEEVVALLGLRPHPEGGFYKETFRDAEPHGGRSASTVIYFLLPGGRRSHWHRVDAVETWHFYAGAPLVLSISTDGRGRQEVELGPELAAGQRPQAVVPRHAWQSAISRGAWTLVGCTVAPGFEFSGFTMAPPDWAPKG